jgi:hypothetical protein
VPERLQVTAVFVVFETVDINGCAAPRKTPAVAGETLMLMGGGGAGGGLEPPPPPPPHEEAHTPSRMEARRRLEWTRRLKIEFPGRNCAEGNTQPGRVSPLGR